jgi:uncharacterized membrane protein
MYISLKLLHLAAAIYWLGGMTLMLLAVRPAAFAQLEGAVRLGLLVDALRRFFGGVWVSIAVLLGTGVAMYGHGAAASAAARRAAAAAGQPATGALLPLGWNLMLGIGVVMMLIFAHLYFAHFRKAQRALAAADHAQAAAQLARIHPLVVTNCLLGWLGVLAVRVF